MNKLNTYTYAFTVKCPNNGRNVVHYLTLNSTKTIMVESIIAECAKHKVGYQEDIANALFEAFGEEELTLEANHHGVDVETLRFA